MTPSRQRAGSSFRMRMLLSMIGILATTSTVQSQDTTESEADAIISDLSMMLKAAEKYRKDTGKGLPITSDTRLVYGYLKISNLIRNPGIKNWKGPYLPYKKDARNRNQYLSHPKYIAVQLQTKEDGKWIFGSRSTGCKQSSKKCVVAACIWDVSMAVSKRINLKIDGVNNASDSDPVGLVRYSNDGLVCLQGGTYPPSESPVP